MSVQRIYHNIPLRERKNHLEHLHITVALLAQSEFPEQRCGGPEKFWLEPSDSYKSILNVENSGQLNTNSAWASGAGLQKSR